MNANNDSININQIIDDLNLSINDIEQCFLAYYPIPILNVEIEEETFENYDEIQLSVLKLFNAGVCEISKIAFLLSLSELYVEKILKLLIGNGHIDGNQITTYGLKSITEEKKVTCNNTFQKYQADGIALRILSQRKVIDDSFLVDKKYINRNGICLKCKNEVDQDRLMKSFSDVDYDEFRITNKDILHVNARNVRRIECEELKFALGYVFKLHSSGVPFFVTRMRVKENKEQRAEYKWIIISKFNNLKTTKAIESLEFIIANDLSDSLKEATEYFNTKEVGDYKIPNIGINEEDYTFTHKNDCKYFVLNSISNKEFDMKLYHLLKSIGKNSGYYLYSRDMPTKKMILVPGTDEVIKLCHNLSKHADNCENEKKFVDRIKKYFKSNEFNLENFNQYLNSL